MFTKSDIGPKCDCNTPQTVMAEHATRRYRVPAGYYGGLYQRARYYTAFWHTLRCDQCGHVRDDFHVYSWHGRKGYYPVVPPFPKERDHERYAEIKRVIVGMME